MKRNQRTKPSHNIVFGLSGLLTINVANAGMFDDFFDPKDGQFDASQWVLDNAVGFLPVPIVITEPALGGFGLGGVAAFFHEDKDERAKRRAGEIERSGLPPSVSGVAAAYTRNDSWILGGFHQGSYKKDRIRYTGVLGYANINLKFYGLNDESSGDGNGEQYTMKGTMFSQDVKFRIADSDFFLGGGYTFLATDTKFNSTDVPGLTGVELESNTAGLEVLAYYDSRDNIVTPDQGYDATLSYTLYDEALGGDFRYNKVKANGHAYWLFKEKWVLALRGDIKTTSGDTPFYDVPFIEMRGIPAMRYQGDVTTVFEVDGRWDFTPRWSLTAFVGGGRATDALGDWSSATTRVSKGVGFRYLAARLLHLRAGIDVAFGPEDTAIYLTIGSAWGGD